MGNLSSHIEAILFLKGEPVSLKELSRLTGKNESDIESAINELRTNLGERGITLVSEKDRHTLATSSEWSETMNKLAEESMNPEIGKSGLETLAVILYRSPVSRTEIDYIRGVNTSYTIRALLVRGLIERKPKPEDDRVWLYEPSLLLLEHLGVSKKEDIPEYEVVKSAVEKLMRVETY